MKPVISLRDLEEMARSGKDLDSLPADALLTPSARDFLHDREGHGTHKAAAAERGKSTVPAKPVNSKSPKAEIDASFNSPAVQE